MTLVIRGFFSTRAPAYCPAIVIRLDQHRAGLLGAAHDRIRADRDDMVEHLLQRARDRDFFHRILDLAVLDPEARRAARIVARHVVDALPHQFGQQQARAELLQHRLEVVLRTRLRTAQRQVVRAARVAGGLHAELARRIRRQEIAFAPRRLSPPSAACVRTPSSSNGALPMARATCGSSTTCTCGANTGLPRLSTRNVVLRYSAPPLTACTNAPSMPAASGASNSTGTLRVSRPRAPMRASARCAA